jgi:CRISPR-associated endonuclease/helicase Cas3/CRISPR-associated endonuclease Cas3-HD
MGAQIEARFDAGPIPEYPDEAEELWARHPNDMPETDDGYLHHTVPIHLEFVSQRNSEIAPAGNHHQTEINWVNGYCHDFGKLTTWFQGWVRDDPRIDDNDNRRYHIELGSQLAVYALRCRGFSAREQAIAFAAVEAHHGNMPHAIECLREARPSDDGAQAPWAANDDTETDELYTRLEEQLDDIIENVPETAALIVERATGGRGTFDEFHSSLGDRSIIAEITDHGAIRSLRDEGSPYADVIDAYSSLKFADVSHSAGVTDEDDLSSPRLESKELQETIAYYQDLNREGVVGEFDELRTTAQETIAERVELMIDEESPSVGRIWLPTGAGKTIGGLIAADRLAEAGGRKPGRLIYTLPFTSIIDQVGDEIADIYGVDAGTEDLIIHHYLAGDDSRRDNPDGDIPPSVQRSLGTWWRSGAIVTSFVQLFETLIAPSKRQAPKIPALRGSVVILDEPQELPPRLWPLIGRVIEFLVDDFDCSVLLMTATQPGFLDYSGADIDVVDLIDDQGPYREFLRDHPRVRYAIHESAREYIESDNPAEADDAVIDHGEAGATIADGVAGGETAMAVCNTVASSRLLYRWARTELWGRGHTSISIGRALGETIEATDSTPPAADVRQRIVERIEECRDQVGQPVVTANLTARHRPIDRRIMLDVLTGADLDDDEGEDEDAGLLDREVPIMITATRLIEAGVDIEFAAVYRDLAPIPSLVQSGGRCNREFGDDSQGTVTLWRLGPVDNDTPQTPSAQIYDHQGGSGIAQTRLAIGHALDAGSDSIGEAEMITTVVDRYYRAVRDTNPGDWGLVDSFEAGDAESLSNVSLIGASPWLDETIVTRTSAEDRSVTRLREQLDPEGDDDDTDPKVAQAILADLREVRFGADLPDEEERADADITELVEGVDIWHLDGSGEGYSPEYGVR